MLKWLPMTDISQIGYRDLYIPARLVGEDCKLTDKYCVKMYSWTRSTFTDIPVKKWYCTNANIEHEKVIQIPFGCDRESYNLIQKYKARPKEDKLFVCFSSNTNERHLLKKQLKSLEGVDLQENLDKEAYIYKVCTSKYVLCPPGNGLDSYRALESIYAGSIPVIDQDIWSKCYSKTNHATFKNGTIYPMVGNHVPTFDDWPFWNIS